MMSPKLHYYVLILIIAALGWGRGTLLAEENPGEFQFDERTVLMLWSQDRTEASSGSAAGTADQFSQYLLQSLRSILTRAGYSPGETITLALPSANPLETAITKGQEQRIRWVFLASIQVSEMNLSWNIGIYDAKRGSLRASDNFSTFPGLSALPAIDDSCQNLVQAWLGAIAQDVVIVNLTENAQQFSGPQEDVEIWYGSKDTGVFAGMIKQGALEGLYIPFPEGKPLTIEAWKEGYWPKTLVLPKGVTDQTVRIPALQKRASSVWGLGTGTGKLLGATYLYRWYPVPDRFFLRFDTSLWAGYSFTPNAIPFWHDELRIGVGLYLQNAVDGRLRLVAGSALSGVISVLPSSEKLVSRSALDILVEPFWVSLEYHFPRWALTGELRLPYAAGSGFLKQGWLESSGGGPFFFMGVLIK
jgi:hypothetical protein